MSNNIKTNALTGYDLFLQQGNKLKHNNLPNKCNEKAQIVDRITPVISIEGIVIEKKEGKSPPLNKKKYLQPIHFRQNLQGRRLINNIRYQTSEGLILPKEVTSLVDNKMYIPRHMKLARDYGVDWLMKLSELALTKGKPSRWYAKVTSIKNWEQTEKMLIKLFKKIDQMKEKLAGIGVSNNWIMYYVGASNKLTEATFNRCVELAKSRGVNKPPNLLAKSIKKSLALLPA
jgi:hypothetical protein